MKACKGQDSVIRYQLSVISLLFAVHCSLFTVFIPSLAFSQNSSIMHVEALGSIPLSDNTAEPDNLVMEDAFKRAVVKAVEAIIPKDELGNFDLVLDDKIYSNAVRYVLNYRILSKDIMEDESPVAEGGVPVYTVWIEADIAVELLTKDMTAAGILHEGEVKRFIVTILNLRSYKGFELFMGNIVKAKGIKGVHYISFARDRTELAVETSRNAQALKQEIMAMDMKEWRIDTVTVSGWLSADKIEVKFLPLERKVIQ